MVIENGGASHSRRVCEQLNSRLPIEFASRAEAGKSRALQWGLRRIGDSFALFLDDDVRVAPNTLVAYSQGERLNESDAILGGPLLIDYEEPPPRWLLPYLPRSVTGCPGDPTLTGEPYFSGANFGVHAKLLLEAGGFDERIGPGARVPGTEGNPTGQESEAQARLIALGCKPKFLPEAKVWHYVPRDRCTPQWALHRAERVAMSSAIRANQGHNRRSLARVPYWVWKDLATSLPALTASSVMRDEQRFLLRRGFYAARGYLRGYRQQSSHPDD